MGSTRAIIAIIAIALVGGGWFLMRGYSEFYRQPEHATVLPSPRALPDFTLVDHNGGTFTRNSLKGAWHLMFFGFTQCPDVCPATLSLLTETNRAMAVDGESTLPDIVLISVDPERDTVDALKSYVSHFGDRVIGLTGDLDQVGQLTSRLGIYFAKRPTPGGGYSVDHSAAVLVINPEAELQALFSAPKTVAELAHDLPLILAMR